MMYFALNFTEVCFKGFNWNYVTITLSNYFLQNKRQAFTSAIDAADP